MTVTEALFNETASADARTVGQDAATEDTVGLGAAEAGFLTLADAKAKRAQLWDRMELAEKALKATDEWKRHDQIETEWQQWERIVEAMKAAQKLSVMLNPKSMGIGCSRSTVPCGQADHLRDVLAAGERPIANEAY